MHCSRTKFNFQVTHTYTCSVRQGDLFSGGFHVDTKRTHSLWWWWLWIGAGHKDRLDWQTDQQTDRHTNIMICTFTVRVVDMLMFCWPLANWLHYSSHVYFPDRLPWLALRFNLCCTHLWRLLRISVVHSIYKTISFSYLHYEMPWNGTQAPEPSTTAAAPAAGVSEQGKGHKSICNDLTVRCALVISANSVAVAIAMPYIMIYICTRTPGRK